MFAATPDDVLEVLHNARAYIARPWGWTKGRFYRPSRNGGTCYCAIGALERAAGSSLSSYRGARNALSTSLLHIGWEQGVVEFNDFKRTKKQDVLAMYDRAIDLVKKGG